MNDWNDDDIFILPDADRQARTEAHIPENTVFDMYWMGKLIGNVIFRDGFWDYHQKPGLRIALSEHDGQGFEGTNLPYFIESLMPESWLGMNSTEFNEFDPNCGDRYLSNIVLRPAHRKTPVIVDYRDGALTNFLTDKHEFSGRISSELSDFTGRNDMNSMYGCLVEDYQAPKMSGAQVKLPAFLDANGVLQSAIGRSFTHIVKLPFKNLASQSMGTMEWFCSLIGKRCGLPFETFALGKINHFGPVFIAERFDIRTTPDDNRTILAEDMCSVLGVRRRDREGLDMIDVFNAVLDKSSAPDEDARTLLKHIVFSWLVSNDDLHLKNMMVVKESDASMKKKTSVRLSPLYDVGCQPQMDMMRDWPSLTILNSKTYSLSSFETLGEFCSIRADEVRDTCFQLIEDIEREAADISQDLPQIVREHEASMMDVDTFMKTLKNPAYRLSRLRDEIDQAGVSSRPKRKLKG